MAGRRKEELDLGRGGVALEERWRAAVSRWQVSGLSAASFCRQEGIGVWSLWHWRRRFGLPMLRERRPVGGVTGRRGELTSSGVEPLFVSARLVPPSHEPSREGPRAAWAEVELGSGRVLRLLGRFDKQVLADVLAVLEPLL